MNIWLQNTDANVPIIDTDFIISNSNILNRSTVNGNEGFGTKEARQKGLGYFYFEFTKIASTSSGQSIGLTQNNTSFSYNAVGTRDNYSEVLRIPAPLSTTGILLDMRDSTTVRFTITSDGVTWSTWDTLNKTLSPIYIGVVLIASSSSVHLTLNTGKEDFLYDISPLVQKSDNVYSFNGQKKFKLVKSGNILSSKGKFYSLLSTNQTYEVKMTSNTTPVPFVASASSVYSTTYPAWRAFDGIYNISGSTATAWVSANGVTSGDITLDFGMNTKVSKVSIAPRNHTTDGIYNAPKNFIVQGSYDGNFYTDLREFTNQTAWTLGNLTTFDLQKVFNYRYYRIKISAITGGGTVTYIAIGQIVYSCDDNIIQSLPSINMKNFIQYGNLELKSLNNDMTSKNYILQDTVSENEQGLWTTQLNRKPLSIKFD